MSLVAPYVDGKLQTSTTSSDSLGRKSSNSVVDSDTFLTLLVAEMQNQDPLEPTSNTEWVSQYATFTQVQQISEMADSMDLVRANNLIGKEVVMKVTSSSTGETSYKRGVVDYVVVEEGKPLLVIDEAKYSLSDLDTVASKEYFNAYDKYTEFAKKVAALPSLKVVDKSYQNTVQNIMDLYNGMSDYEKNYLKTYAAGYIASYEAYVKKLKSLGVTFNEGTQTKETTLDDLISAFDKKMTALMEQIAALKGSNSSSGSSSSGNTDPEAMTRRLMEQHLGIRIRKQMVQNLRIRIRKQMAQNREITHRHLTRHHPPMTARRQRILIPVITIQTKIRNLAVRMQPAVQRTQIMHRQATAAIIRLQVMRILQIC